MCRVCKEITKDLVIRRKIRISQIIKIDPGFEPLPTNNSQCCRLFYNRETECLQIHVLHTTIAWQYWWPKQRIPDSRDILCDNILCTIWYGFGIDTIVNKMCGCCQPRE